MGLSPTNNEWCVLSDLVINGCPWAAKIVDDIIIQARDYDELLERAIIILDRCREMNMIISKKKLECGREISFAGHIVGDKGVSGDPKLIQ
jgi:hypothetical protein